MEPTEEQISPIAAEMRTLAEKFRDVAAEVSRLEASLEAKKAEFKVLREVVLPEAMEAFGSTIYRLPDGTTVEIVPEFYVRIPEGNEERAFDYLERSGHGGLIKRQITVAFNKDQEEAAAKLLGELRARYAAVSKKSDVHWATLTSWAKKQLEAGEEIDESITCLKTNVAKVSPTG